MTAREGVVQVRIRYPEVDRMGLAHHANHFVWFEIGRTEFMRERGTTYAHIEEEGITLPVIEAACRYAAPARYDEQLIVRTTLTGVRKVRITFSYRIERETDGTLVATGSTTHAAVDRHGRPCRLPDRLWGLVD